MEPEKPPSKSLQSESLEFPPDPQDVDKVKSFLHSWASAVSAMKIFSFRHETAQKFIDEMSTKITQFLLTHRYLEIRVHEYSFFFGEKEVYTEKNPMKSPPFLFYKDGVQTLFFYRGVGRKELEDFLEIQKTISLLPPDEADIVNAMWEKEFMHIRYTSIDDFLEIKIAKGRKDFIKKVDTGELSSGRIQLTQDDQQALQKYQLASVEPGKVEDKKRDYKSFDFPSGTLLLDRWERQDLNQIISTNRTISPEQELIDIIMELLYLEDKLDQLMGNLEVLREHHNRYIEQADFARAYFLYTYIQELAGFLPSVSKNKADMVQDFLKNFTAKISLDKLKEQFLKGKIVDLDSFFKYLELIGPRSISLAVDLTVETKEPVARAKALDFLLNIGKKDIFSLMKAVREDSPAIAQDIIDILIRIEDPRAVEQFSRFLIFNNQDIKAAAIRALGRRGDVASNNMLLKFMADPDEAIRHLAVDNLRYLGDRSLLDHFSSLALDKKFKKKGRKEKEVILNFLGRSREAAACATLEKILAKSSLFSRSKQRESRFLAISALENMRIPEAKEVLQRGTKIANKKIQQACKMALRKIAFGEVGART